MKTFAFKGQRRKDFPIFSPDPLQLTNMGLGVLEDTHLEHVPGTAPLAEVLAARDLSGIHDGSFQIILLLMKSLAPLT